MTKLSNFPVKAAPLPKDCGTALNLKQKDALKFVEDDLFWSGICRPVKRTFRQIYRQTVGSPFFQIGCKFDIGPRQFDEITCIAADFYLIRIGFAMVVPVEEEVFARYIIIPEPSALCVNWNTIGRTSAMQ